METLVIVNERDTVNNKWLGTNAFVVKGAVPRARAAHAVMDWYIKMSPAIVPTDIKVLPISVAADGYHRHHHGSIVTQAVIEI